MRKDQMDAMINSERERVDGLRFFGTARDFMNYISDTSKRDRLRGPKIQQVELDINDEYVSVIELSHQ